MIVITSTIRLISFVEFIVVIIASLWLKTGLTVIGFMKKNVLKFVLGLISTIQVFYISKTSSGPKYWKIPGASTLKKINPWTFKPHFQINNILFYVIIYIYLHKHTKRLIWNQTVYRHGCMLIKTPQKGCRSVFPLWFREKSLHIQRPGQPISCNKH